MGESHLARQHQPETRRRTNKYIILTRPERTPHLGVHLPYRPAVLRRTPPGVHLPYTDRHDPSVHRLDPTRTDRPWGNRSRHRQNRPAVHPWYTGQYRQIKATPCYTVLNRVITLYNPIAAVRPSVAGPLSTVWPYLVHLTGLVQSGHYGVNRGKPCPMTAWTIDS